MGEEYYPDNQMMFAPEYPNDIPEHWRRFFELREDLLLNYDNHNTVRAYWGDLQDWFEWAVERDKDVLELTDHEVRQYVALLRRRKYSENTIRPRVVVRRLLTARRHSKDLSGLYAPMAPCEKSARDGATDPSATRQGTI